MLVQAETVTDLVFMKELSQLITFSSKSLQKFDVLPFEIMKIINCLKKDLQDAKDAFEKDEIPSTTAVQDYKLWSFFKSFIQTLLEFQTFKDVPLLVPGDRGRVTRSGNKYGYDSPTFSALIKNRYSKYAKLLGDILDCLQRRFEPWPTWLVLCNKTFNFEVELTLQERQTSLHELMDCPFGASPLLPEEKKRLSSEFITLTLNADKVKAQKGINLSQTELWYELLTNEACYTHSKKINAFALRFLNRSFNEAVVEVEVSSLNQISTEYRPLKQNTTEMLNFISTNGPHPLVSMNLVDDFLNARFGKKLAFHT